MAIAFVQAWTGIQNNNNTGGTTAALTTTSGNFIAVATSKDTNSGTDTTSDSKTNTWREAIARINNTGDYIRLEYAYNITGGASHTITITTGANRFTALCAAEFSGLSTTDPKDQTKTGTGSSTSLDSGNTSATQVANELLIGLGTINSGNLTWTAGASYALRSTVQTGDNGAICYLESRIVSATGTYNAPASCGTNAAWIAGIATFWDAPPAGGGGDQPTVKRFGGVGFASHGGYQPGTGIMRW